MTIADKIRRAKTDYDEVRTAGYNKGKKVGYDEGHDAGFFEGRTSGYESGYNQGYIVGEAEGYTNGYSDGTSDGYFEGYGDGKGAGIEQGYEEGYDIGYKVGYADGVTGSTVTFQKDESTAYIKTIPNNAEPKAMLLSVGGMTYRDENTNTLRDSKVTEIIKRGKNLFNPAKWVNAIGEVEVNGVRCLNVYENQSSYYEVVGDSSIAYAVAIKAYRNSDSTNISNLKAMTPNGTVRTLSPNFTWGEIRYATAYGGEKIFFTGYGRNDICIDLSVTQIEIGTTATEYEPYHETIYTIPEEITALDGYGEGTDDYSNTLDIVNKELAIYGKKYVLTGSEKWSVGGATSRGMYRYYTSVSGMKNSTAANGLCDKYPTFRGHYNENTTESVRFGQANSAIYLYLYDNLTATEVAERVKGMTVFYELAEPKVVDISAYLADFDNILDVERGGSIEFVNEYGQAVPSSILYTKKVGT